MQEFNCHVALSLLLFDFEGILLQNNLNWRIMAPSNSLFTQKKPKNGIIEALEKTSHWNSNNYWIIRKNKLLFIIIKVIGSWGNNLWLFHIVSVKNNRKSYFWVRNFKSHSETTCFKISNISTSFHSKIKIWLVIFPFIIFLIKKWTNIYASPKKKICVNDWKVKLIVWSRLRPCAK